MYNLLRKEEVMFNELTQLNEKCASSNKPIDALIVEHTYQITTQTSLHFIVNWASEQNASESLDFLISCLQSIEGDSKKTTIDTIYLYQNKEFYKLDNSVGFRKIGVYH